MKHLLFSALTLAAGLAGAALPSHWDGGRVTPVHRLEMKDLVADKIVPEDHASLPVSTRQSCSLCHDYAEISKGWHFNASDTNACPGRMGEPWFLIDPATGTQLPMSLRGYTGTFKPDQIGMSDFDFVWNFSRNMPGGDIAAPDEEGLMAGRWNVSGPLEINCFICHDQSGSFDFSEYVRQVSRQNFAWAMSAAMGWGLVDGMGVRMPDYWGVMNGLNKDDSIFRVPPNIVYDAKQFDSKNRLVFKVGKPKNESCLNCHGVNAPGIPRMDQDSDVHLRAGMSCTDCHRNGVDHKITRGYDHKGISESEMSLTCAGCHVAGKNKAGRYGAPEPKHVGIPVSHFKELSCTVCHSGMTRNGDVATVTTSRANRMGVFGKARWVTDAPYIQEPVFVRNSEGKIEPRRIAWPAYWGRRDGEGVKPLENAKVAEIAGKTLSVMADAGHILAILDSDPNHAAKGRRPVIAVDGKLYRANIDDIPALFGEKKGLNGYFYVDDADRGRPEGAGDEVDESDKIALAVTKSLKKLWPAEKVEEIAVVPPDYNPSYDATAVTEEKFKTLAAEADKVIASLLEGEKEEIAKMSAEDQKTHKEDTRAWVIDGFKMQIQQRLTTVQDEKTTRINNLITTLEASDLYKANLSGAVVTSGKIFFKNRAVPDTVHAEAPKNAAATDFGFYDAATKSFTSIMGMEYHKQVAKLADTTAMLTEDMVAETLTKLAAAGIEKPVYIGHGQVWEMKDKALVSTVEKVAEPVSWAFAHDVRPARQARGAKPVKCADCHTVDSKFFFAKVSSTGPLLTDRKLVKAQNEFMDVCGSYHKLFGTTFLMRPLFKIFLWVVFAIVGLVAVAFTAAAMPTLLSHGGIPYGKKSEKIVKLVNTLCGWAMGCACAYLGISGAWGWYTGAMSGYLLVFHMVGGGLFSAVLLLLIWFRAKHRISTKRSVWWMLALLLGTLVVFTAVAPMMTIFGEGWQHILLQAHRCSAFCFLAVGVWMLLSGGRKE